MIGNSKNWNFEEDLDWVIDLYIEDENTRNMMKSGFIKKYNSNYYISDNEAMNDVINYCKNYNIYKLHEQYYNYLNIKNKGE